MRSFKHVVGLVAAVCTTLAATLVGAPPAHGAPVFKAPFPCGQRWTYDHHSTESRLALDFIRSDGGATAGVPVLATAAGRASRRYEAGGAGNYVIIDHGGGWTTYYFHLAAYSVPDGAVVAQGQQIGTTGRTGNATGPHIHYEQLFNGVGQTIVINGGSLAPYPGVYYQKYLTSDNNCGGGTPFWTWGSGRPVRGDARLAAPLVTTLAGPTLVYIVCQKQGDTVTSDGYTNAWWSKLRVQKGFISNIYIAHPAAKLPGIPVC